MGKGKGMGNGNAKGMVRLAKPLRIAAALLPLAIGGWLAGCTKPRRRA